MHSDSRLVVGRISFAQEMGLFRRNEGMAQTLEAEGEPWIERALRELRVFSALPEWPQFKTEDFRAWLGERLPEPHDHHVWGALTNRACREGIIKWSGRYVQSVSPKTHAHPVKLWTA